ncbi:MAG: hypothetical protein RLZZ149_744, partial [Pseudomonadota bacterium]
PKAVVLIIHLNQIVRILIADEFETNQKRVFTNI